MTTRELVDRLSLDLADDNFLVDDEMMLEEISEDELMDALSGIGGPGSLLVH